MNAQLTPPPAPDANMIHGALSLLFGPDDVIELRAISSRGRKQISAGYFDGEHRGDLVKAAMSQNASGMAVYVTLNPVDPQLLNRHYNRVEPYATATATDGNITRRRWLLVDIDPVRPKDTAATDAQREDSQTQAKACYHYLKDAGWPEPVVAESGNGFHMLYPIDLPNDDASRDLVKGVLAGLAALFDTDAVKVDQSVYNASRITKLYGTVSTKGDHTPQAPWRLSRLLATPERSISVTPDQLRTQHPASEFDALPTLMNLTARGSFDLHAFLEKMGIAYEQDQHEGGERYKLAHCPFNPEHGKGEAAIFRRSNGALGFKCLHYSCRDQHWQELRTLIDGPRESRSSRQHDDLLFSSGNVARTVELVRGCDVTPEPVEWLWQGWLAAGKMHVLGGAPGTGKTTIALALAATVSTGGRWPDGTPSPVGNVVIWSGEDDPADTLIPRLIHSGADVSNVYFIADVREGSERRAFDPARDMDVLRHKLAEIGNVRLLIVDPIVSAVAGDSHKNAEVRRDLQPLADLAALMRCALLGITHFSKGTGGREPVERLTGSLAFGALARVVFVAAKHQEQGEDGRAPRLFLRAKSNIGPDDGGFEYDLQQGELIEHPGVSASSVLWGAPVAGLARELLATAESIEQCNQTELSEAIAWLQEQLSDGDLPSKEVKQRATRDGLAWATVRRAQKELGIKPGKTGFSGGWVWALPVPAPAVPEWLH